MRSSETKDINELEKLVVAGLAALPEHSTEAIRGLRREFSRKLAQRSPELLLGLATRLASKAMGARFIAYELVYYHKPALRSLSTRSLEELGRGIDNWGAVDAFSCYLAGPAWRERQVSSVLIRRWARSKDRWWRRASLVCTVPLNSKARGGTGDVTRTLEICRILLKDRDDMVVKAMSWALRELAKREPKAVSRFLSEHRDQLASRVIREVNNKLNTGLKNTRRRR